MILGDSMLAPRREPTQFSIVAVIGHPHLWPNQQDLAIEDDDATVVEDILMYYWPDIGTWA